MGSYLSGADVHDFLACLGKHAVEKVSFSFPDLITVEPDCCNIVFVEDTDEFMDCADGASLVPTNKEEKGVAADGWEENMQKEGNPGWSAEPSSEVRNDAMPSDTGWGTAETHLHDGGGWGNEQGAMQNAYCLDSMEQDKSEEAAPVIGEGGWGSKSEAAINNGWDPFSDVNANSSTVQTGTWTSTEAQHPRNEISKGGLIHPSRKSRHTADSPEDFGESKRHSGNFAPSGTNTVPLGTRRRFMKAIISTGGRNDKQCEEKDHTGWGAGAPSLAGDDAGWEGSNQEEEKTPASATEQGSHEKDWASGMDWETSDPTRLDSKNGNPCEGAWQSSAESEVPGMDSWGNDNGWNCKRTSETCATAPVNSSDGWDSMEGHESRKGCEIFADINDKSEKQCADEWKSGKFAPSGSNAIPLGERSSEKKPIVSNSEPESMMSEGANIRGDGDKENETGWANCELKTMPPEDLGWNNSNHEGKKMLGKNFEELSNDGWGCASKCKRVPAGCQGIENDEEDDWNGKLKNEGSSDLPGWGSKLKASENVQDDGWGNTNLDSPSVLHSDNCPKASPQGWNAAGFKTPYTHPSRGFAEQDVTPRSRKRFNRDTPSDSWTGFASRNPQPQSSRSRLRSLMNSPEYAELGELYKAANRILHHNEYQLGDKLNAEDESFILEKILVHHRDKEAKVGCGVDYVMIDSHPEHQVSCFWVVRKDGLKTDFSYWKCLESLYESKYSQGVPSDGVKKETIDGWNGGLNYKASATDHQAGGDGSGAATKGTWERENAEGSLETGDSSASLRKSMFDKEETKGSWDPDTRAGSDVPVGEAKDWWNMGASSMGHTNEDGWDMLGGFVAPTKGTCDSEEAQNRLVVEANSAVNICDQAVSQNEAEHGCRI